MILEPGVYDMPEATYHGDPVPGGSLSSTVARLLLPPSCPALARYRMDNPEHKDAYDFGSVVHALILGKGSQFIEVHADDWRGKAAKDARDAARADGHVPLLSKDLAAARAAANAVHAHPVAPRLLQDGAPERVAVWRDPASGVWCRAMFDWWPDPDRSWHPVIVDVKTSTSAAPSAFRKSVAEYGYHQQAAHYLDGYEQVHGVRPAWVFVVVTKTAPHLVSVFDLDDEALAVGAERNRRARDVWQQCQETGVWPGYDDEITTLDLPKWAAA